MVLVVPSHVMAAIINLAMLEPKPGAKLSDGCEAMSQLSVKLLPYAPGPGFSAAEAISIIPGLEVFPPESQQHDDVHWPLANSSRALLRSRQDLCTRQHRCRRRQHWQSQLRLMGRHGMRHAV